jgi:NADH:ubiquinone oxidoreductase subunit 3 (subunit A)
MNFLFYLIFTPILVIILLILNAVLSVSRPDVQKLSVFECGLNTILNQTRAQFNISYYLIAILFLLFDLEIVALYPYALSINIVGVYGF